MRPQNIIDYGIDFYSKIYTLGRMVGITDLPKILPHLKIKFTNALTFC